ncbi:MAG TPA: DUF945 family protein [Cellvibrionaceae bacterium]
MKKIMALVLLVLAYIGASFYAGVIGEQNIRQQLALSQAHTNAQGVVVELTDYQRGIFSSQFQLTARLFSNPGVVEELTINSDSEVKHGPLMFADGLKWGLFYAKTDAGLITANTDTPLLLRDALGDALGQLSLHGHFNGSYTAAWNTPPLHYAEQGEALTIDGFAVALRGNFNALDMQGDFTLGAVNYRAADGAEVNMTPLNGVINMRMLAENIPLTDVSAQVDELSLKFAGIAPMVVRNIQFNQSQKMRDSLVESGFQLTIAYLDSLLALENLYYGASLTGLSVEAVNAWTDYGNAGVYALQFDDTLRHALALTFTDQLKLSLTSGAELFGGRFTHSIDLQTRAQYQGSRVSEVDNMADLLAFLIGSSELRVSKSVVTGSILILFLAEYLDTYLIEQGDDYVFNASLEGGVLRFADVAWPLAELMTMGNSATPVEE